MADEDNVYERARAWVLVRAGNPRKFTNALAIEYKDHGRGHEFGKGGDDLVIVRADVVDGEKNVVIPVDAKSDEILETFVEKIRQNRFKIKEARIDKKDGALDISVLKVKAGGHNPMPPHRSSAYVTAREIGLDHEPAFDKPGRHPKSPGRNAWG